MLAASQGFLTNASTTSTISTTGMSEQMAPRGLDPGIAEPLMIGLPGQSTLEQLRQQLLRTPFIARDPMIHINGLKGIGKYTIARALRKRLYQMGIASRISDTSKHLMGSDAVQAGDSVSDVAEKIQIRRQQALQEMSTWEGLRNDKPKQNS